MTVLAAGTFRVNDYRRNIPVWVKVAVAIRYVLYGDGIGVQDTIELARDLEYDHSPGLLNRPYDKMAGDFIPKQNDPDFIFAQTKADHLHKTTGRKPGAEKTVSGRGSDITEAARAKKISDTAAIHRSKMLSKAGDDKGAALALSGVKKKNRLKPKRKITSRPFQRRTK